MGGGGVKGGGGQFEKRILTSIPGIKIFVVP